MSGDETKAKGDLKRLQFELAETKKHFVKESIEDIERDLKKFSNKSYKLRLLIGARFYYAQMKIKHSLEDDAFTNLANWCTLEIEKVLLLPERKKLEPKESENIFCKGMPLSVPIEHFKVFTERESKNNKSFLTKEAFDSFILRAFCGSNEPKQALNFASREKGLIIKRFYEFYNICHPNYENTQQCRDKYIKLLTDNFINWDFQKVKNNFGNTVIKGW